MPRVPASIAARSPPSLCSSGVASNSCDVSISSGWDASSMGGCPSCGDAAGPSAGPAACCGLLEPGARAGPRGSRRSSEDGAGGNDAGGDGGAAASSAAARPGVGLLRDLGTDFIMFSWKVADCPFGDLDHDRCAARWRQGLRAGGAKKGRARSATAAGTSAARTRAQSVTASARPSAPSPPQGRVPLRPRRREGAPPLAARHAVPGSVLPRRAPPRPLPAGGVVRLGALCL